MELRELRRLARLCGVQPAYHDVDDRVQAASVESLRAVLAAVGYDGAGGTTRST